MTNYERGRRWEWEVRRNYERAGFLVIRSAGSKGPIDLVALGITGRTYLIQCKIRSTRTALHCMQKVSACYRGARCVLETREGWDMFENGTLTAQGRRKEEDHGRGKDQVHS